MRFPCACTNTRVCKFHNSLLSMRGNDSRALLGPEALWHICARAECYAIQGEKCESDALHAQKSIKLKKFNEHPERGGGLVFMKGQNKGLL